ncbi:MAG: TetR family transcriptional regulator [Deltaproteobacteria bacterium]|nr:TetR family transcriptional regulator [Deltaproteobacteria bacterium]
MKAKSSRGASTRQRILETAAKLVNINGVNGTSVDDVLNASGTGKSQFYHYFANKEALVKELIDFQASALPAAQESVLAGLSSLAGIDTWLDQIIADYHAGLYANGCPLGNLASELATTSEQLRLNLQATFANWEGSLSRGLKSLQSSGQIRREFDSTQMATFCIAAIEGALLLAKTEKSVAPLKATIEQIRSMLKVSSIGATKLKPRPNAGFTFCP